MTRMARSQTNFAAPNQGLAKVSTQFTNQAIPQFQSDSAGLDPFRGDMTNAFNNFFGSINNSISSVVETQRNEEKRVATEFADDMKARAANEATDYYMQNPEARDVETALETEDVDLRSNRHFVNTYKKTLGNNIGSRLYSDFTTSQASANPANFEANAQSFWEENYSGGTGDPQVDLAMQTAWTRNYENNRISAAQETIRRQRAAAALEHRRSIYRGLDGDISVEGLNELMGSGSSSGGETKGQLTARNFGIIMEAVSNGDLSNEQLSVVEAWINHVPEGPNGETGQSIAQRFPILADKAELQLPAIRARNATIEGQEAVTDITNKFNEGMAQFDDPVDQMNYLNQNAPAMIEQLRNTRGVSGTAIADLRKVIDTRRVDMLDYVTNRNAFAIVGAGGKPPFGWDPTDPKAQTALVDAYAAADSAVEAGNILGNTAQLYGPTAIPDPIKEILNAQLTSPIPQDRLKAAQTILQASGVSGSFDGSIQDALLGDDAQLRMNVIRDYMDQGQEINGAVVASGRVDAAIEQIDAEGIEVSYGFTEGTKAETDLAMGEFFSNEEMLTYLESTVEGKGFIGRVLTWQNGSGITAEAQAAMRRAGDSYIYRRRAEGQDRPTQGEIRKHVSDVMVDRMFLENGIWTYDETVQPTADGRVRVGYNVYNAQTGKSENTVKTMTDDIATLENSFFAVNFEGDFRTIADPDFADQNGRMVMTDGMPVDLSIGTRMKVDDEYFGEGERRGQRRGLINDGRTGWNTLTLTGDPETDAELLFPALGPGIILKPNRNGDGDVTSYGLTALPRFTEQPSVDVESEAQNQRAIPNAPPISMDGVIFNKINGRL